MNQALAAIIAACLNIYAPEDPADLETEEAEVALQACIDAGLYQYKSRTWLRECSGDLECRRPRYRSE